MRIDFSEPECSTCYRHRTSSLLNAQESEPVVSVATTPVTSEPVQEVGRDSAAAGSDLIVEALGHESAAATVSTSTSSPLPGSSPVALGSASAVASAGSASTQAIGQTSFGSGGESAAPKPSPFGSNQAPTTGSTWPGNLFLPPKPSTSRPFFGTTPVSPSLFATTPMFKDGVTSSRTDVGSSPASSSSNSGPNPSTSTIVFGTTPVSVSSLFGPAQHSPTTSFGNSTSCFPGFGVGYLPGSSSNSFGPKPPTNTPVLSSFERFSTAPAQDSTTTGVETSSPQFFGFQRVTTQLPSFSSTSSTTSSSSLNIRPSLFESPEQGWRLPCDAPTPLEEPISDKSRDELRWEYYNKGDRGGSRENTAVPSRVDPWGKPFCPADVTTSSQNGFAAFTGPDFGPKPSTTTPLFNPVVRNMTAPAKDSVFAFKPSPPKPLSFNTFTTTQLPSSPFSSSAAFSSNSNFGSQLSASHGKGSRLTRYGATPIDEQHSGIPGLMNSISASPFYRFKSHEELRWEDYSRGDKGGSRPNTAPPSIFNTWRAPAFASFPGGVTSSTSPFGQTHSAFTNSTFGSFPGGVTSSTNPFGQTHSAFTNSVFGSFPGGVTSSTNPFGQANAAFGTFPAGVTSSTNPFGQNNAAFKGSGFAPFPAGVTTSSSSPFGQTNGAFTGFGTVFPSSIAPSYTGVPGAAYMAPTMWGGPQPLFIQRPHETAAVSSPSSGCTACGAMSSSSAPAPFSFNCATTPTRAATTPTVGSPMVFATNFVAYPAQSFILLPFSAMSLH